MCIAIYKPAGKELTRDLLFTCYKNNPDGCGFAYVNVDYFGKRRLKIYKDMTFDGFYKKYERATRLAPYSPFIIHFRIGTHGEKSLLNCHPFSINNNVVFCHNGIISGVGTDKRLSDTQLFNQKILKELPKDWMYNQAIVKLVEDFIGASKLILLNIDGEHFILNESKGSWVEGCWMSNTSYKERSYSVTTYQYPTYQRREKVTKTILTFTSYTKIECDFCGEWYEMKTMGLYQDSPKEIAAYCPSCLASLKKSNMYLPKELNLFEALRVLNTYGRVSTFSEVDRVGYM